MDTKEILERLDDEFEGVLKADGYNDAIIGVADGWFMGGHHTVVAYDYHKCVEILVAQGMDEDEAEEWLQFNTLGAYVGERTPVFVYIWRDRDQT